MPCATWPSRCSATARPLAKREAMPVFGTIASRFNDDGVTALYQALKARLRPWACRCPVPACRGRHPPQHRANALIPGPRALPGRDLRHRARLQRGHRGASSPGAKLQQLQASAVRCNGAGAVASPPPRPWWPRPPGLSPPPQSLLAEACDGAGLRRATSRGEDPRTEIRTASPTDGPLSGSKIRKGRLPRYETTASCSSGCCWRTCPAGSPSPPACLPSNARAKTRPACSPARATPPAPTAASSWVSAGQPPSACPPPSTRSPYGTTPTCARHLRQGRQQRRQHRHARRHEGALRRLRPVRPPPRCP